MERSENEPCDLAAPGPGHSVHGESRPNHCLVPGVYWGMERIAASSTRKRLSQTSCRRLCHLACLPTGEPAAAEDRWSRVEDIPEDLGADRRGPLVTNRWLFLRLTAERFWVSPGTSSTRRWSSTWQQFVHSRAPVALASGCRDWLSLSTQLAERQLGIMS